MSHIYSSEYFNFSHPLETYWKDIYQEYLLIKDKVIDCYESERYEGTGWKIFPLFDIPHGNPLMEMLRHCPMTAALLDLCIPQHGMATFSILKPNTRILPHPIMKPGAQIKPYPPFGSDEKIEPQQGYQHPSLKYHLGLNIPSGDCGIKINGEHYQWKNGEVLIFDDRYIHEAWNFTPYERVIFILDIFLQ